MKKVPANTQTKMIGLRVTEDMFALIEGGAEGEDISPTAYVRLTLARALNYEKIVPETKPRKTPKRKPLNNDIKAAIDFLGLLIDVKMNLSFVSRKLSKANVLNPLRAEEVINQGKLIERVCADVDAIRTRVLGERS